MLAALEPYEIGDVGRVAAGDRGQHLLQRVVAVAVELRGDRDVRVGLVELRRQPLDRRRLGRGVALPDRDVDVSARDRLGRGLAESPADPLLPEPPPHPARASAAERHQKACSSHLSPPPVPSQGSTTDRVRCCGLSGSRPRACASATAVSWIVDQLRHRVEVRDAHGRAGRFDVGDQRIVVDPCRTLVYKGMLTTEQLGPYFDDDLGDPLLTSALCMFHSRFSTNTFPSWQLAHPYRMISHNGEINTLRGNINWMQAREALFASELYEPGDIDKIKPIIREGLSDTACLDNAVELLVRSGYTLAHAMMMLIPEAWENHESMSQVKKDFYKYHSCLMEPWDGPASVTFTDGKSIGAVLDRNGLRPSRYVVTDDDRVIMASEVGALEIAPERIVKKGRLEPGKMFLVDLQQGGSSTTRS